MACARSRKHPGASLVPLPPLSGRRTAALSGHLVSQLTKLWERTQREDERAGLTHPLPFSFHLFFISSHLLLFLKNLISSKFIHLPFSDRRSSTLSIDMSGLAYVASDLARRGLEFTKRDETEPLPEQPPPFSAWGLMIFSLSCVVYAIVLFCVSTLNHSSLLFLTIAISKPMWS
jgi:hypothetical protein